MRYRGNLIGHDWSCCEVTVLIFCIILITNQTICLVKCNFVQTKSQNVRKMSNCWTLFQALYMNLFSTLSHIIILIKVLPSIAHHSAILYRKYEIWYPRKSYYYSSWIHNFIEFLYKMAVLRVIECKRLIKIILRDKVVYTCTLHCTLY